MNTPSRFDQHNGTTKLLLTASGMNESIKLSLFNLILSCSMASIWAFFLIRLLEADLRLAAFLALCLSCLWRALERRILIGLGITWALSLRCLTCASARDYTVNCLELSVVICMKCGMLEWNIYWPSCSKVQFLASVLFVVERAPTASCIKGGASLVLRQRPPGTDKLALLLFCNCCGPDSWEMPWFCCNRCVRS